MCITWLRRTGWFGGVGPSVAGGGRWRVDVDVDVDGDGRTGPSPSAGLAKEIASVLPACVITARRLRGDARVPLRARIAVGFAALWVLSPIDLSLSSFR